MICLIQARVGSRRLPNKIFKKIRGKTLMDMVLNQTKKSKEIKKIVVVTSINKVDDKISEFCKKRRLNCVRGSLHNVASRFLKAADKFKSKAFVRISADSPIINSKIIDSVIKNFKKRKIDISTNVFPRSFPRGQSVEVIKSKILRENISVFSKKQQEHVTTFFYDNYKRFKIFNLKSKKNISKLRLCVDTKRDLVFLNNNLERLLLKKFI